MNRFRLITFDVTGTILKFRMSPGEQYARIGSKFGISADPSKLSTSFKAEMKRLNAVHPNFGAATGMSWDRWWSEVVRGTFYGAGISLNNTLLQNVTKHLISTYSTSDGWEYCEGAKELLDCLRESEMPLGVISNFDDRLDVLLISMGIRDYFRFIVSSYNAGCQKPDPRIFDIALKLRGCDVKPEEALHIGDTYEKDYVGATQAGWNAYIVHEKDVTTLQKIRTECVFENLSDLQAQLL